MMFGVPAACLAIIKCAEKEKRKAVIGLLSSAAICSFICGVTEPFEFAFMFMAPGLYVVYSLLYGIFSAVVSLIGFRAGFCFSGGVIDLLFSASLPAAQKTWLIIPLGIGAFVVFYGVFRISIVKFNLKTQGREDDEKVSSFSSAKVHSASDYTRMASVILEGLGGNQNLVSIDNCISRLRLEVAQMNLVDEAKIKSAGAKGIIKPGSNSIQIVIGTSVQFVADEMKALVKDAGLSKPFKSFAVSGPSEQEMIPASSNKVINTVAFAAFVFIKKLLINYFGNVYYISDSGNSTDLNEGLSEFYLKGYYAGLEGLAQQVQDKSILA